MCVCVCVCVFVCVCVQACVCVRLCVVCGRGEDMEKVEIKKVTNSSKANQFWTQGTCVQDEEMGRGWCGMIQARTYKPNQYIQSNLYDHPTITSLSLILIHSIEASVLTYMSANPSNLYDHPAKGAFP